jgi:RNA polymerase sigma-70 factor, ECF subfamily
MSVLSRVPRYRGSTQDGWLMDDPPAGKNELPDDGAPEQGQPEPGDFYDGVETRGVASYAPFESRLTRGLPEQPGISPVYEDQVSALSDGIPEWIALEPDEAEPADAQIVVAPDLDAFYEANFDRICRRLAVVFRGDVSHAEDITQEAFVTAYRNWPRISSMANPYGYVAKIAWRLAMKWLEAQHRERQTCADLATVTPSTDAGGVSDIRIDLGRALDRLPEQLRTVAGLSLLGYTPKDLAGILGIPPATARTRLKRARDRLVELMQEPEEGPET